MNAKKASVVRRRLIAAVSRYARGTQKQVTVRQFCKAAKVEEGRVHEHFPGGIGELLAAAGLGQRVSRRVRIDFEGLMGALDETARLIGRVPTPGDMDRVGRVTARTYYDRMKNWGVVREEYARWKRRGGGTGRSAVGRSAVGNRESVGRHVAGPVVHSGVGSGHRWHRNVDVSRGKGRVRMGRRALGRPAVGGEGDAGGPVGRPLMLPGMRYAPTCESGVVYVFGLLARELGFQVERVGTAFPDCVALRRVEGAGPETWKRVAVEFEFRSSNFRAHGHDAAGCGLIVCWEHDWKGCPVEVMELKGIVERMEARAGVA